MSRTFRGVRADLHKTQVEMADALGIPLETYKRYEKKDPRKVPLGVMADVAELGGIDDIREFLKGK